MRNSFYSLVLALLLVPAAAFAGPILRSGETISVDAEQVLKGDFYGFSPEVTISGTGENDAYVAGGSVTVNAPIGQDLSVLAGTAQIHGDIGDDLRVVGGGVVLANEVKGDVAVAAGSLVILSTAKVAGDVLFLGGKLTIEGDVAGSVHGTANEARFNSEVGGDVDIVTQAPLIFGDKAVVLGNVIYASGNDLVRATGAEIVGSIQKIGDGTEKEGFNFPQLFLLEVSMLLFAALTIFFIQKGCLQRFAESVAYSPGILGLAGLGIFFFVPFVGGLLLLSVLGSVLGIVILLGYAMLLIAAFVGAGIMLGYFLQRILLKKTQLTIRTVIGGVILFSLLGFIPAIGGILVFACVIVMLGLLGNAIYRKILA
jgi:hypothetical protein